MSDEHLFLVDEQDRPLDFSLSRTEVHRELQYWHRTSGVIILNDRGQILCHQRSLTKDRAPGAWNHNFGGHVVANETPEENCIRELAEEVGISCSKADLTFIGKLFAPPVKHAEWVYALSYRPEMGALQLSSDEVAQIRWFPFDELRDWSDNGKFLFPFYDFALEWLASRSAFSATGEVLAEAV